MRNLTWAQWVREVRQERGWTPVEVAATAGVHRSTAWRWERGGRPDGVEPVVRLADAVGRPRDEALAAAGLHAPRPAPARDLTPVERLQARLQAVDVTEREVELINRFLDALRPDQDQKNGFQDREAG